MGKRDKAHRAKVQKRKIRQYNQSIEKWNAVEADLKAKGYDSIEEAVEKDPEIAKTLPPNMQFYALDSSRLRENIDKLLGDEDDYEDYDEEEEK